MKTFIHNKLFIIYLFLGSGVLANNVSITNARVIASDTTNLQTTIEFDISWENSWRSSITPAPPAPPNWDAAWVFVKYRVSGGNWLHAWLNNTGHTAPSGSTIDIGLVDPSAAFNSTTNPGVGAFIYRSADGVGTFSLTDVQLKWNYGANGLTNLSIVDVQIYGLEMVYIPQASFYLGSGGTETCSFTDGSWRGTDAVTPSIPYQVTSENAITLDSSAGNLWGTVKTISNSGTIGTVGSLPAEFPKGYKSFYCMKHGISQQGYVNFLNTLTRTQQAARIGTSISDTTTVIVRRYVMRNSPQTYYRQGIRCDRVVAPTVPITFYCDLAAGGTLQWEGPPYNQNLYQGNGIGGEADDGIGNECNFLSAMDICAYLDWAGLRPITELEHEKVCRGDQTPVPNEYPWGVSTAPTAPAGYTGNGTVSEVPSNPAANQAFSGTLIGPMRVGAFAGAATTRAQAGAGYYGVLEMGGSLWHLVISAGKTGGRAYTGAHGDGLLDATGNNNVGSWPSGAGGASSNNWCGYRGGTFYNPASYMTTSFRGAGSGINGGGNINFRWDSQGGRGVRAAP